MLGMGNLYFVQAEIAIMSGNGLTWSRYDVTWGFMRNYMMWSNYGEIGKNIPQRKQ